MLTSSSWIYLGTWVVMLLVSVANGAVRDFTYGKRMTELAVHQLSTVTSVLFLGVVMWICLQFYPPSSGEQAIVIGLVWTTLTIGFEFVFFRVVGGHSWAELLGN